MPALQVGLQRGHGTHLSIDDGRHGLIEALPVGLFPVLDSGCSEPAGLKSYEIVRPVVSPQPRLQGSRVQLSA